MCQVTVTEYIFTIFLLPGIISNRSSDIVSNVKVKLVNDLSPAFFKTNSMIQHIYIYIYILRHCYAHFLPMTSLPISETISLIF